MPTLKEQVLNCKCTRQTDAEALERVKHILADGFIIAALKQARAGCAYDGHNSAVIGLTQTESRVLQEQVAHEGPIRHRVMTELPAQGIAASLGGQKIVFALLGDPTPPRPQT